MKIKIFLQSVLRKPVRAFLFLVLFGLVSFGFITKAIGYVLVQHETKILGSYYRSIGTLENTVDPQSGDVSAGIKLIESSPLFAYGDQRQVYSAVMPFYNADITGTSSDNLYLKELFPEKDWTHIHDSDIWFTGTLNRKEAIKDTSLIGRPTIGYALTFMIDTILGAYPEDAAAGQTKVILFLFEGKDAAIQAIDGMETGQRYFIRARKDMGFDVDFSWTNTYQSNLQIVPLDNDQLWYVPVKEGSNIDFSSTEMAPIKNEIDILNENQHTLTVTATADMSAIPRTQEASRFYYLLEGRWLNHQDDLSKNKVIVVPDDFAKLRGVSLGDAITFTFRPLKDTILGYIRDSVDKDAWRKYPTYQDTFTVVGIYANFHDFNRCCNFDAYIPTGSLKQEFASVITNPIYKDDVGYSFVLKSSRDENEFVQNYKARLEQLGISLVFLENNGQAFWAAVDPIRSSAAADLLIFGALMVVALVMAVFLYIMQHKREYAILRALGVPAQRANRQLASVLLLMGGIGIICGGAASWNYALTKARETFSTIPTPAGVVPSADLNPIFLLLFCAVIFVLLLLFCCVGVAALSSRPVYELLQGQTAHASKVNKDNNRGESGKLPAMDQAESSRRSKNPTLENDETTRNRESVRKYKPSSLCGYVLRHALRSKTRSALTAAMALVFILASAWILATIAKSKAEIDKLYDTTVVDVDIIQTNSAISSNAGSGFVSRQTVNGVLRTGFIQSSYLEANTEWYKIEKPDVGQSVTGTFSIFAFDSFASFKASLGEPDSLVIQPGFDTGIFDSSWTLDQVTKDGLPAIFPKDTLDQLQLHIGDKVKVTDQYRNAYACTIIGVYSGGMVTTVNGIKIHWIYTGGNSILIPLGALESMEGKKTEFSIVHFSLDPKKNREIEQFKAEVEKLLKDPDAGIGELRLVVWDEELRIVVAQLEKNLSILRVLYPVVLAVSVLIGAGLCFLLCLQSTREAAILRVLGVTKVAVRMAVVLESFTLSVIGLILGAGVALLLWSKSGLVPMASLFISAGLYLAGALAGLVMGALSVTNKQPIELLQVKE